METQTKQIRGLRTGWLQAGSPRPGQPILFFIHGFPDSAENWRPQLECFARTHLVIAPFLRGMEPSETTRDKKRYGLDEVALDHLAILDEVDPSGTSPVVIVGHDIGGPHAWHLARHMADTTSGGLHRRLEKLVLINGPSLDQMVRRFANPRQLQRSWYIGLFLVPKLAEAMFDRWGERLIYASRKKSGWRDRSDIPAKVSPLIQHYREMFFEFARQPFRDTRRALRTPPKLDRPVLVLWGRKDPFLLVPTVAELNRMAAHHSIRVLDGGHWLNREMPDKVNALIESFLKENPSAST